MQRTERTTNALATLAVVVVLAMVLPALAATAQGSPVAAAGPASASATQQWAYGGAKWVNVSLQLGNASYSAHTFFGWQVIFTATNTTTGTVALEAQRTMAASLFASYCAPNCTKPTSAGNLSIRGNESDTGFANLTALSQVYENGTATPALGIDNASSQGTANLNESYSLTVGARTASGHLTVTGSSHGSVAFQPSLGLVPWNVGPNVTWNSSAAYAASGAWSFAYQYGATSLLGASVSGSGSPNGTVSGTGSVTLVGAELGTITLANGRTVPVIAVAVTGPFDDVDGFLLVPHGFEIFGVGHHDWDGHSFGAEQVSTSRLDIALDATGHRFQVVASATSYAGTDSSLLSGRTVASTGPAPPNPPGGTVVQGQPETVADAQHSSTCLTTNCAGTTSAAGSILPFLLVGLVAVVVVGTVGIVEYRSWSRRKSGGGQLVGGYSQQVPASADLPPPPAGPSPPAPPSGGA